MTSRLLTGLCIAATIAGCGRIADSRINPVNWFGGGQPAPVATAAPDPDAPDGETRPLMDQVTQLRIERMPGGAIIHATGLPPTQGYWEGELVPVSDGGPTGGVLAYQFRANEPLEARRVSTAESRYVEVATRVSTQDLAAVQEVRVTAARNALAARR